uniref:Dynein regulatory complex subunit 3 n=1 Tax=Oryctolagus cuniculus TaxID=9986 RepID=A0A5F9DHC1_RABIT
MGTGNCASQSRLAHGSCFPGNCCTCFPAKRLFRSQRRQTRSCCLCRLTLGSLTPLTGNMSRLHNSIEPRVMDDEMLKLAVSEQGPREEAGQLAKQEGILFKDVLTLQLDFQNILHIDNLWQFENLRKLQLDNNIIERIEGLENLVHLVWLDLSFNNIEVIEGLDSLVNLEDLSLFNNRISRIDSLDALGKLQVLSLGNNQIDNIMNLVYLRRFKCLRTLSLAGNPIAQAEDYKMFIYAYLPDLVYLDFRRIGDHMARVFPLPHPRGVPQHLRGCPLAQAPSNQGSPISAHCPKATSQPLCGFLKETVKRAPPYPLHPGLCDPGSNIKS